VKDEVKEKVGERSTIGNANRDVFLLPSRFFLHFGFFSWQLDFFLVGKSAAGRFWFWPSATDWSWAGLEPARERQLLGVEANLTWRSSL
jgi:hypothetical protein